MIALKWEPRDLWVGVFIGEDAVYICLIPTVVIKIARRVLHVAPLLEEMAERDEDNLEYKHVCANACSIGLGHYNES